MRVRFYVNSEKPSAASRYPALAARAAAFGLVEVKDRDADVILALGGDGTILRAVHDFRDIPVLGLNLGGLGYLSAVGEGETDRALEALASGRYTISERRLLEADGRFVALNDIVITREMTGHAVRLDLEADGKFVTRYLADGIIFATPTGSTAYSLAAGGPVLVPNSESVVVTPMNPHALGVRPLVLSDDVSFRVTVRPRTSGNAIKVGVYADGENVLTLSAGDSLVIGRSAKTAKFVEIEGYDPYEVLARKLGWNGSNVL